MSLAPKPFPSATNHEVSMPDAANFNPNAKPLTLWEAIASDESRTKKTVLFLDIAGSTAAKESQPEATWVTTTAWFYAKVLEIVERRCGKAVFKFLGDGIMVTVDNDEAAQAIMGAIEVQEAINEARGDDAGGRVIDLAVCIGIASGDVRVFTTPDGAVDFLGSTCDRASRLSSVATPNAILIDRATGLSTNWNKIESRVGKVTHRKAEEYQGDPQRVALKGFSSAVDYFEVFWDHQLYGLKSSPVTAVTTGRLSAVVTPTADNPVKPVQSGPQPKGAKEDRRRGVVKFWNGEKHFGRIADPRTGEEFHTHRKLFVYPEDTDEGLKEGTEVVFVALDSSPRRLAAAVLVVGNDAEGKVVSVREDQGHAWLRVFDMCGNSGPVYLRLTPQGPTYKLGEMLSFCVAATDRGAMAVDVSREEDEAA